MAYHAFVVMPYGTKAQIDFNKVYSDLIKPALEGVGFEVFRSDEEMRAGDIRTDMFQELLMADLIVADLSIRRGQLTSLTLDLGQFTGGGAHLPLRLEFSGGDAVAVTAPGGTEELQPQDLVAALMYGALGTERF